MEGKPALLVATGDQIGLLRQRHGVRRTMFLAVSHHREGLFPRIAVAGTQHTSREHHGVHGIASGEDIFETRQQIALVVVGNGFLELEQVGGVLLQGVFDLHLHTMPLGAVFRLVLQRRRHQHVVVGILEHHILVKFNEELLAVEVAGLVLRLAAHSLRRLRVLWSTAGIALLGAR